MKKVIDNFSSIGKLEYSPNKLIVLVDPEITNYYRSLVPKYWNLKRSKYLPHITVIREEKCQEISGDILFTYIPTIYRNDTYAWLNVYCEELCNIRKSMGLEPYSELSKPPDGTECFHSTIGNFKS